LAGQQAEEDLAGVVPVLRRGVEPCYGGHRS
jgi:hypothetical protein